MRAEIAAGLGCEGKGGLWSEMGRIRLDIEDVWATFSATRNTVMALSNRGSSEWRKYSHVRPNHHYYAITVEVTSTSPSNLTTTILLLIRYSPFAVRSLTIPRSLLPPFPVCPLPIPRTLSPPRFLPPSPVMHSRPGIIRVSPGWSEAGKVIVCVLLEETGHSSSWLISRVSDRLERVPNGESRVLQSLARSIVGRRRWLKDAMAPARNCDWKNGAMWANFQGQSNEAFPHWDLLCWEKCNPRPH